MFVESVEFLKVTAGDAHFYNCTWNDWRL